MASHETTQFRAEMEVAASLDLRSILIWYRYFMPYRALEGSYYLARDAVAAAICRRVLVSRGEAVDAIG